MALKNFEFLFTAYLVVWGIFFVYDWTVSRRLARLADEVARLKERAGKGDAGRG